MTLSICPLHRFETMPKALHRSQKTLLAFGTRVMFGMVIQMQAKEPPRTSNPSSDWVGQANWEKISQIQPARSPQQLAASQPRPKSSLSAKWQPCAEIWRNRQPESRSPTKSGVPIGCCCCYYCCYSKMWLCYFK